VHLVKILLLVYSVCALVSAIPTSPAPATSPAAHPPQSGPRTKREIAHSETLERQAGYNSATDEDARAPPNETKQKRKDRLQRVRHRRLRRARAKEALDQPVPPQKPKGPARKRSRTPTPSDGETEEQRALRRHRGQNRRYRRKKASRQPTPPSPGPSSMPEASTTKRRQPAWETDHPTRSQAPQAPRFPSKSSNFSPNSPPLWHESGASPVFSPGSPPMHFESPPKSSSYAPRSP